MYTGTCNGGVFRHCLLCRNKGVCKKKGRTQVSNKLQYPQGKGGR